MTQISIKEWGAGNFISMIGHADTQQFGKDIVCAGLSAYAYFLNHFISVMEEERKVWCPLKVFEPGNVRLLILPNTEGKDTLDTVIRAVKRGLKAMEAMYPKGIKFEEKEGD